MERCGWVSQDPLYIAYHDNEWGVPETDSKKLFEMICLEGQQAGLSWRQHVSLVTNDGTSNQSRIDQSEGSFRYLKS